MPQSFSDALMNPMSLAGLAMQPGVSLGDALVHGAQAARQHRQAKLADQLPQMLASMDFAGMSPQVKEIMQVDRALGMQLYNLEQAKVKEQQRSQMMQQALQGDDPEALVRAGILGDEDGLIEMGKFRADRADRMEDESDEDAKRDYDQKQDMFGIEKGLRGEFNTSMKDFYKQQDAYGRVVASADEPSAAGDLALIFNYMKVLDPGSTVREGEFANAQNAGGVNQKVMALYNNVMEGERLTPEMRQDFVSRADKLYRSAEQQADKRATRFKTLAEQYGGDPNRVVGDYGLASKPKQQKQSITPPINTIEAELKRRGLLND